jgi:uncharacterized RDD family membrane protein YckC
MKQYTAKLSAHLTRTELKMSLLVFIIYAVGIAGMTIPVTTDFFVRLIPAVLILSLVASLAFHRQPWDLKTIAFYQSLFFCHGLLKLQVLQQE